VRQAGAEVGLSSCMQTAGSKVRSFGQWAVACAAPLVSLQSVRHFNCKPLLVCVSLQAAVYKCRDL